MTEIFGGVITGAVSVIACRVIEEMLPVKIKGDKRFFLAFAIVLALAALIGLGFKVLS